MPRYAFGGEAHIFQHFCLADYASVSFGQLVERLVIVFLQSRHAVAEGEESVGEAYYLFIQGRTAFDDSLYVFHLVFPFPQVERETQGADEVGGAHQYYFLIVGVFPKVGIALYGKQIKRLRWE